MDIDAVRQSTLAFVEAHGAWAPAVAGLLAFLSLLVPDTLVLMAIGALIGSSDLPFRPVMAGAAVGAALGDWLSYEVGRDFKDDAKRIWPMSRYPVMTAGAEAFLRRWGAGAVEVGRFIGPARAVVPLIAGSFGLGRLRFQVANVVSAIVWAFVRLAPGAGPMTWWRN